EGITTVEIHRSRPDWFLFTDGVAPGPPDHPGETPEQVGERADRVLATVEAAFADTEGCVVLVAHGHFLRVLTA
ncbi:histidine phosphatase family protein, partial [Streptomyces sp. SID6648]|nr:histidine phosphatase family protein [Streptomyces sp. SID6648]